MFWLLGAFSLILAIGGLVFGELKARSGAPRSQAGATLLMSIGAGILSMGFGISIAVLAVGIGGLLTLLPVAWANSFERLTIGAIGSITLPVQINGQADGLLISGNRFDATGDYHASLTFFTSARL